MVGAPALAANAALRSGAGLVKLACPKSAQQTIASVAPCATSVPLPSTRTGQLARSSLNEIGTLLEDQDVLAIGPGMGQGASIRQIVTGVLGRATGRPAVVDADGLNALADTNRWWTFVTGPVVLTPHPGEMRRLLRGAKLTIDEGDREAMAVAFARLTGQVVVLKGAGTVVADGEQVYVNQTGNPGMATGGTGDVLTGVIAGLLGQGLDPVSASVLGVHVHGKAGDLAAKQLGQLSMTAADVLDALPAAFKSLSGRQATKRRSSAK
jgi:NAD(P)H-hydrate epimerase